MNEYVEVEQAKSMSGLRLVLSRGLPTPWGEAAKNVFKLKGIPYRRVTQYPGLPNEELKAWTGMNNAPIAIYNDETPVGSWFGILNLAERLSSEPSLIPDDEEERVRMFGLCHEICGEDGLNWNRRLLLTAAWDRFGTPADEPMRAKVKKLYGYSDAALRRASGRVITILHHITDIVRQQQQNGSRYLVGQGISAADVHFSTALAIFVPLPHDQCPMHEDMRALYEADVLNVATALDPVLFRFRQYQYEQHLFLPLDL